jgi:hypothetical protein
MKTFYYLLFIYLFLRRSEDAKRKIEELEAKLHAQQVAPQIPVCLFI